ncbi:MAG: response regulator [Rubrivivax sp.]|nr:response regulator [Rubrivivax sp.]
MALEELGVDLVECEGVDGAEQTLRRAPAALVVTDLMLGAGRSGIDLLDLLAAEPTLRAGAPVLVCTASGGPGMEAALAALGAWRVLHKPVPVAELLACVREALALPQPARAPAATEAATTEAAATEAATTEVAATEAAIAEAAATEAAIARHFGGDAQLYAGFRERSLAQFPADIAAGDAACAQGDLAALRRLLHSLKTVLALLGDEAGAASARQAEAEAAADRAEGAVAGWAALRGRLERSVD